VTGVPPAATMASPAVRTAEPCGPSPEPIRVVHIITRMIVGGAQENTLLSCALIDRKAFPSDILSGVEVGSEGSMHEDCRARGVPLILEASLVRRIDPIHDLRALFRITRFLRRHRYDVVHTHTLKAGIIGRWAAWLARVPIVVHTAHGWAFTREEPALIHWLNVQLERICARLCQAIVVVAERDRAPALALRIGTPRQFHLIRSGIEIEAYRDVALTRDAARARIGIPADAFVVGTVGRLVRAKSPVELFQAFEHVARRHPRAHLVYVGDGPMRVDVEDAAGRVGLRDRVHVLGIRRDVPELLRAFDALALASRWEGLPRVFPQAMAAGLPIVATRVAGAPEAITPDENGWLVEIGDMEGMGRRLNALADDPGLAQRMGDRGRARVEEFSARRMVDGLAELYSSLALRVRAR
jgi:glycosyltransferase involved in cell wall biosynthesis